MMWAVFNITNRCNFTCSTCLRGYPGRFKDMTLDTARKALARLRDFGWSGVSLTGGEPFLHPRFEELVDLIVSHGYRVAMVTSGWFHEKYRPIFLRHRTSVGYICVSVDGATAETHDLVRGVPGSFDRAVEALRVFRADGIRVKAALCLNKRNVHELRRYVDRFRPLVDVVNVMNAIPCDHNLDIVLSREELESVHRDLRELTQLGGVQAMTSVGLTSGVNFCSDLNNLGSLTLNYDGGVVFCCDTIYEGAVLGNVNHEELGTLIKRAAETTAKLLSIRVDTLGRGEAPPGFNSCQFCNTHLKDIIARGPERKPNPIPRRLPQVEVR